MSVVSVRARSFILALFIRDDGERFLLGDRGFDFKDSQLHFSANNIENDEVAKQGVDGVMLAGQVRRASVQSFDGYVGDATTLKEEVEQMRRDFIAFFAKGHHFRVIYIDCNRNAWQRKGGYLVDAPEVKELWQIHPEYHVGLNFEDVNYYEYDENADGQEILANIMKVPISRDVEGGLVWDENGAVSEPEEIEYDTETATASGTNISIADAVEAPLKSLEIQGETSQNGTPTPDAPVAVQTVTGENVVKINGKNLLKFANASNSDRSSFTYSVETPEMVVATKNTTGGKFIARYEAYFEAGKTYIFSLDEGARRWIYVYSDRLWGTMVASLRNENMTFTPTTSGTYVVGFYTDGAAGTTFELSNTMAELGSTATAYEPYRGQSYEVNLGKNLAKMANGAYSYSEADQTFTLLDGSITTTRTNRSYQGGAINISTGVLSRWSKNCVSDSHLTGSGGTYTLTFSRTGDVVSSSSPRACIYGFIYDNDGNNTSGNGQLLIDLSGQTSGTYTLDLAADRHLGALVFYSQYISYSDVEFKVQLEKGSQATSYAPYFTPIELCKIGTYQDSIYKSGGKWYVRKEVGKIAFTSTTAWTKHGTTGGNVFILDNTGFIGYRYGGNAAPALMDTARVIALGSMPDSANGVFGVNNIASQLRVFRGAYDASYTADTFKDEMVGHYIYGALATPTDTEITNEALVGQLEAILDGGTSAGTNNITTIISAGNAQGELEITYYTKYDAKVVGGYVWEAGGSGGPTIVTNESISAVSPVWTVFGPALNPMLENTTTGEQIQYVGMISEGQTLVVDMGEQTASLDGLNVISNIVGEYLTLAPGSNTLLFSADSDAPASEIGWSEIVG